ncbi:hypothetical protein MMC14_003500 [Varicellaria rhodocarpa]|nr:hypothetical protein [Varicellaria rhodocarpa]
MPPSTPMSNRRFLVLFFGALAVICFIFISSERYRDSSSPVSYANTQTPIHHVTVQADTLKGDAIMGKLGNETLKAELGRAAWKLFHTTMARFPDTPTDDEQTALFSYVHLFARLYPCGECASHFRAILTKFPPQVKTRSTAAAWACHVHNEVNKSLQKALFDCSNIGDFYNCGCAEEGGEGKKKEKETADLKLEREG